MNPVQAEEVLKQLDGDYSNLKRIFGEDAIRKHLAASRLNPTQFNALFADSFGAFDLAAGGIEAAYTDKTAAAKALHAVANLRKHADVLQRLSAGQRVSPAELAAAQNAIQAYNVILRSAPAAAVESLKQLQRIVLNSDVELPALSHGTPDQIRAAINAGHLSRHDGFHEKPQIESLIGSTGHYNDAVAAEVQNIAADYLHHQADHLAPGLADAHAPAVLTPQPAPVAAAVEEEVETPEEVAQVEEEAEAAEEEVAPPRAEEPAEALIELPEPRPAAHFNEDHLIDCIIKADQLFARTLRDFMQRSLATHAICIAYMQFNFAPEVLEFRAIQAAIINSYQAAIPVMIHAQFTFFRASKLDLAEEFAKTRELARDERQLGNKADEFGIDVDSLKRLVN